MAQFLSTFNRLEQSRFEAFRRSTFSSDAISKYVAQIMIEGLEDGTDRDPVLSHLCSVGQAPEITMVVSTLAKVYAQRLIHETKVVAGTNQAIRPQHILQAVNQRLSQSAENDFFLQNALEASVSTSSSDENYSAQRQAAIRLQELYDSYKGTESQTIVNIT